MISSKRIQFIRLRSCFDRENSYLVLRMWKILMRSPWHIKGEASSWRFSSSIRLVSVCSIKTSPSECGRKWRYCCKVFCSSNAVLKKEEIRSVVTWCFTISSNMKLVMPRNRIVALLLSRISWCWQFLSIRHSSPLWNVNSLPRIFWRYSPSII